MSSQNKSRRYIKNLFVYLLFAELLFCILLIGLTIGIQIYNLVSPPIVSDETPALIGEVTLPFNLNSATVFPFLMLPLLFFVVIALFLQHFFSKNGFGFSDRVLHFDKYPHTRLGARACTWFICITSAVSFVLCCACSAMHQLSTPWFGLIVVVFTGLLHANCSKMLRHRRRQYLHNKKKEKGAS